MESREFGLDGIGLEYRFVGKSDILEVLLIRDCVGESFSFSSFLFLGLINLLLRRRGKFVFEEISQLYKIYFDLYIYLFIYYTIDLF